MFGDQNFSYTWSMLLQWESTAPNGNCLLYIVKIFNLNEMELNRISIKRNKCYILPFVASKICGGIFLVALSYFNFTE